MRKIFFALFFLLTFAFQLKAQIIFEGKVNEPIRLKVSGLIDREKSNFKIIPQNKSSEYTISDFDKQTGIIEFTFYKQNVWQMVFQEEYEGCMNQEMVRFSISESDEPQKDEPQKEDPQKDEPQKEDPQLPEPQKEEPNEPSEIAVLPDIPEIPESKGIELSVPNIFTPNGDGVNDLFHVNYNIKPKYWSITIFNREGKVVYTSNNPDFAWDGSNNCPGTYFYVIKYNDAGNVKKKSGFFSLVSR